MEGHSRSIEGVEGVVKWFDPRKGFGFIVGPEGQDIFTHYTVIQGDGFRVLKDGASVSYDAVKTDKGWKATRVHRVEVVETTGAGLKGVAGAKRGYSRTVRQRPV
ncbi:MAG TPA: cold shock domain-containing protein [Phycisphaerales bacterium]|nr:cold shock domain-containing protein [Phycisphaerales bacterium]